MSVIQGRIRVRIAIYYQYVGEQMYLENETWWEKIENASHSQEKEVLDHIAETMLMRKLDGLKM